MTTPTIYVTRKIPEMFLESLRNNYTIRMWSDEETPVPRETLLAEAKEADAILCMLTDQIDETLLENNPHLKVIANLAVGYDNIDLDAAREHGIIITNTPDVLTETTADLTFALLMTTARRIVEANQFIKDNEWENWAPYLLAGTDVHHSTIGIVGMGRIGEAVARRARGFGMTILYHSRHRKTEAEASSGAQYVPFDELIQRADFVVPLLPLTPETHHLFDEDVFRNMKNEAFFINASRGNTVDENALYQALLTKEIKGAGLDVFQNEPIKADHPLMNLDKVIALPHIGSASTQTRSRMIELCLDNIDNVLQGDKPMTPVDE